MAGPSGPGRIDATKNGRREHDNRRIGWHSALGTRLAAKLGRSTPREIAWLPKEPPSCALRIGKTACSVSSTHTTRKRKTGKYEAANQQSSGPISSEGCRRRRLSIPSLADFSAPPSSKKRPMRTHTWTHAHTRETRAPTHTRANARTRARTDALDTIRTSLDTARTCTHAGDRRSRIGNQRTIGNHQPQPPTTNRQTITARPEATSNSGLPRAPVAAPRAPSPLCYT